MHSARPSRRLPAGFTLIELLTVIAIIGILAAMVIATTQRVRSSAATAKCGGNMRAWTLGMLTWAQDNRELLPTHNAASTTNPAWQDRIAQQTFSSTTVNRFRLRETYPCPKELAPNWVYGTSYGFLAPAATRITRLGQLRDPSRTILLAEMNAGPVIYSVHLDEPGKGRPNYDRHDGRANFAFADGHMAAHTLGQAQNARLIIPIAENWSN
jgi:prepilin-type N-terminal cleavage/methylation domain-containing protein/prepilin-type processing-associated H-X9-DG protein